MSNLYEAVNNLTETENGALTFKSTLDSCLDLFALGGAYRNRTEEDMLNLVTKAWNEDHTLCVAILCYLRDCRGGIGEKKFPLTALRHLFRTFDSLNKTKLFDTLVELGCWKDIFSTFDAREYASYVQKHMETRDISNPDLMFKWMPSVGGGRNKEAGELAFYLNMSPKEYRKMLSKERARLNLVESQMCSNEWSEIQYDKLPSRAGFTHRSAFARHDNERYTEYNNKVSRGEAKMNATLLYPYEIVKKVLTGSYSDKDSTNLNNFWNNIKDFKCEGDSIVVADVSGSMTCNNYTPLAVSISLALYFAERNKGKFKNEFITFSENPTFHTIKGDNIVEKVNNARGADWGMSTNLQSVFDLILDTAKRNKLPSEELPKNIYIVSDMEFNDATTGYHCGNYVSSTNFEEISRKYRKAGYERPNLIFWNVASHKDNVPVTKNEEGVALVSGCSPSIFEMAITNDLDPIKFMNSAVSRYMDRSKEILGK